MSEDDFRLTALGALVVVAVGVALRLTDRGWLVDLLDAPSLSEAGNVALGIAIAGAWYTVPLVLLGLGLLFGRPRRRMAKPALWTMAVLAAVAVSAYPSWRWDNSPYNVALREQVPGFDRGMLAGSVPLLLFGAGIWLLETVRSRRARER